MRLTFACGPYDRTAGPARRHRSGPEGIELNYLTMQPAEIFWRMLQFKEFDVSEMSLSNYTTLVSTGQLAVHRHPGVSVARVPPRLLLHQHRRRASSRRADLKGKRGGVPEYSMTAAVLHARAAAARIRRQADRRRMGAGPHRPARPQAAGRHPAHPGAGRHRARRSAGARRDRLHDDGQQSAVVPARRADGAAAVSELRRGWRRTTTGAPRSIRSCTRW